MKVMCFAQTKCVGKDKVAIREYRIVFFRDNEAENGEYKKDHVNGNQSYVRTSTPSGR